ncbi:hypothetical protein Hamer_G009989 [Homarus americanus]|uniref:Uncharacterized protein n=1 Tax=Homarus americanus TaxID=6706 RepID=A0A8J5JJ43_HOMAM|nr:hypothetical protein Hamer_G009989 [Homarus americanus]
MVSGPEVARVIEEFKDEHQYWSRQRDTRHHDQIPSVQTSFIKDVHSLVSVIEELGKPFEEESLDMVALHTKEIASPSAAETVGNAKSIGQDQFQTFTRERLMEGTKPVDAILHRNKQSVQCFHLNIRLCTKNDLLACLGDLSIAQAEAPSATSVVLDGAAVLQMLKPAAAMNFEEYAQEVFIPYMLTKLQAASRLDLVFDSNKTELFKFLSDVLLTWFDKKDNQLVIIDGQAVLSKLVLPHLASIAHAITKKQTVARCCMHPMQPSMTTIRY